MASALRGELIPQAAAGTRASGVWCRGAELGCAPDNTIGQQESFSVIVSPVCFFLFPRKEVSMDALPAWRLQVQEITLFRVTHQGEAVLTEVLLHLIQDRTLCDPVSVQRYRSRKHGSPLSSATV